MHRGYHDYNTLQFDPWQPSDFLDSEAFSDLVQLLARRSQELRGRRRQKAGNIGQFGNRSVRLPENWPNIDQKVPLTICHYNLSFFRQSFFWPEDHKHHRARSSWLAAALLGPFEISVYLGMSRFVGFESCDAKAGGSCSPKQLRSIPQYSRLLASH